mmetsp:Transcript_55595/g.180430  ORF Transcript_55595/g.180430 Transcript_55595/m.180430 type:complete len:229 (-) Transcript_55595:1558-2244(-)
MVTAATAKGGRTAMRPASAALGAAGVGADGFDEAAASAALWDEAVDLATLRVVPREGTALLEAGPDGDDPGTLADAAAVLQLDAGTSVRLASGNARRMCVVVDPLGRTGAKLRFVRVTVPCHEASDQNGCMDWWARWDHLSLEPGAVPTSAEVQDVINRILKSSSLGGVNPAALPEYRRARRQRANATAYKRRLREVEPKRVEFQGRSGRFHLGVSSTAALDDRASGY